MSIKRKVISTELDFLIFQFTIEISKFNVELHY
jgi:hypothetical protein